MAAGTILIFNFYLILFTCVIIKMTLSYNYKAIASDERIIIPCEGQEEAFVDKFVEMPDVKFFFTHNDILVQGSGNAIKTFQPDEKVELKVTTFVKKKGFWVRTVFSLYRPDFCKVVLDPEQVWYGALKNYKEQFEICPPPVGTTFFLNNYTTTIPFEFKDRNLVGNYKVHVLLEGSKKSKLCFVLPLELSIVE
ncbi:uncharacterized protein LOC129616104 [Condylostylus longicornis]|uniref:uncharacterized protein LOC129616104 n=1 Tax=Condylostylus longicornis TaxID=2530218 RepID=UPI00244DAE9C|nr:uncharacterized protein LOC129616104 [Condylostylus longicornis]